MKTTEQSICLFGFFTGSQGQEFLILFMENNETANQSENAYILTEDQSTVNITSSPLLEHAIKSNVDGVINFTSYVNISFPSNLVCQYLKLEPKAVLLTTSEQSTVVVFDKRGTGTNDGTLVLPTRKLSTEYLVSSLPSSKDDYSQFAVGILHENTYLHIFFKLGNDKMITYQGLIINSGTSLNMPATKHETVQFAHDGDFSGTRIIATKPVAVFSGNKCRMFPGSSCSHMVSQLPPTQEYDNEYIIPSFYQNTGTLFQVISPVQNTVNITFEQNTTIAHFNADENKNFELGSSISSVVKSEHPVQITGFAMGSSTNGPYMTVLPGINHYLDYYKILVPQRYRDNFICVIIPIHSLDNLKINNLSVTKFDTVSQNLERSSGITYYIFTLRITHGVYVLTTTDNMGFGLLVYGHRHNDGYGYSGNFVLQ